MRVLLIGWSGGDVETEAAAGWLAGHGLAWRQALAATVEPDAIDWADAVWCHASAEHAGAMSAAVRRRLTREGGVLLTLAACRFAYDCGLEAVPPVVSHGIWNHASDTLWDDGFRDWPDYPHLRGMQGWPAGTHPLFDGFQRGTYTRTFAEGDPWVELGYDAPSWPARPARVVAVERAYVRLNARRAVVWEYPVGERRVLCIGAHIVLQPRNPLLRAQRDRLLGNALALVARRAAPSAAEAVWPVRQRITGAGPVRAVPVPLPAPCPDDEPTLVTLPTEDAPFTIAGRRALVVGSEGQGIRDIWVHPLGVVTGGVRLTIGGAIPDALRVQLSPSGIRRTLRAGDSVLIERITPAIEASCVHLAYEPSGARAALDICLDLPLRLEWPFDPDALRPLTTRVSEPAQATRTFVIEGCDGFHCALVAVDGADSADCELISGVPRLRLRSAGGVPVRLLVAAGAQSASELLSRARAWSTDRSPLVRTRERHFAALRQRTIHVQTPEAILDGAVRWAVHRLDMFMAAAPDGGEGLLAGFAASGDGWCVSRPGYAWFFGRDACWCADAMLAAGMFEEVRAVIRHLADTRDVTGKIIHELTTSAVAHYDAADSTPLFLRLVAAYHEWTGDDALVRDVWDGVRQAFDFVTSTDRDGDGLPENTDVGHGWIESGPLGGGVATSYVAAIWIDALRRLGRVASALDDGAFAAACAAALQRAGESFESRLRAANGRVALQLQQDGTPQAELTALSAVPIALGVDDNASADGVLSALCEPAFTTPWGVRLLPANDPRYNPRGYHAGAVWPLFTGWTALACFARGHSSDGARLLRANAALWTRHAKGAFDEVLDGDTGAAAGVCPDQAWSAAMVVSPLFYGLWGVRPNAAARTVRLGLQIPDEWVTASIGGIRVGHASLDVRLVREPSGGGTEDHITLLVHDGAGALETVIVEVLADEGTTVHTSATSGAVLAVTKRPCRPGWHWHGVAVSLPLGEGHLVVRRAKGP